MTTPPTVHVMVVEWQGTGEDPWVYVGATWHAAARAAARAVWDNVIGEDGKGPNDWPEVGTELPLTQAILNDPEQLAGWLAAFREGITVPWVTEVEERVLGA